MDDTGPEHDRDRDAAPEPTSDSETGTTAEADAPSSAGPGRRDVVVPMEIYKVVTVFSMLIAITLVVGGFLVLDTATERGTAAADEVNVLAALAGLGLVGAGGVVYVFSTRFRAEGMGNAKDDTDEPSDNG